MYIKNKSVTGHMNICASSYAEQNHSSLCTRVKDDRGRTLVCTIAKVIVRTDDIFKERKVQQDKWSMTARNEFTSMSKLGKTIYQEARFSLVERAYVHYQRAIERSSAYRVTSVDGGEEVTSASGSKYFIPSGGRCEPQACKIRQAYLGQCHHELAVRKHLKLPLYDNNHWHKRHLNNFDALSCLKHTPCSQNLALNGTVSEKCSGPYSMSANSDLLCSEIDLVQEDNSLAAVPIDKPVNKKVSYNTVAELVKKYPALLSSLEKDVQNVVYTHLCDLYELLSDGPVDCEKNQGSIEGIAKQLSDLKSQIHCSTQPGYPVIRAKAPVGKTASIRLGSRKSMANKVITCGFCETKGHNKTSCAERISMGFECKSIGPENAGKLIGEIRLIIDDGGNMKLPKLAKVDQYASHNMPPKETMYLQLHGYTVGNQGNCILCSCFKRGGDLICVTRMDNTVSYAQVLLPYDTVMASLGKYKYTYFKPMSVKNAKKTPMTRKNPAMKNVETHAVEDNANNFVSVKRKSESIQGDDGVADVSKSRKTQRKRKVNSKYIS